MNEINHKKTFLSRLPTESSVCLWRDVQRAQEVFQCSDTVIMWLLSCKMISFPECTALVLGNLCVKLSLMCSIHLFIPFYLCQLVI